MHALGVEPFMVGHIKKRLDNIRTHLCRTGITRDAKTVSAAGNFDIKATFNLAQVFVKLTAEVGKRRCSQSRREYSNAFRWDLLSRLCSSSQLVFSAVQLLEIEDNARKESKEC